MLFSPSQTTDAFEAIVQRINRIDPSWIANRGSATNAAGFFTGDARGFALAIDAQGRIWATTNVVQEVSWGPGVIATINYSAWRLIQP